MDRSRIDLDSLKSWSIFKHDFDMLRRFSVSFWFQRYFYFFGTTSEMFFMGIFVIVTVSKGVSNYHLPGWEVWLRCGWYSMRWWGDEFSWDRVFHFKILFDSRAPYQHIAGSIRDRSYCLFQCIKNLHSKACNINKNAYW